MKVSVPETAPMTEGEKTTLKGTVCPAAMVSGNETPEIPNCELFEEAEETVTLPVVAVIVELSVALLPSSTFPKFRAVGVMVSTPVVAPVPVNGTIRFGPRT